MPATRSNAEVRTLFARARQILVGNQEPPTPTLEPIDMRQNIDRALYQLGKRPTTPSSLEIAAARAVSTVEGTLVAMDTIHEYLVEALELTRQALQTEDPSARALFADRYEQLRIQIDMVANGASFEGVNLIDAGQDAIEIRLVPHGNRRHSINHIALVAGEHGLSLTTPTGHFLSNSEMDTTLQGLMSARQRLDRAIETLLNQASMLAPHLGKPVPD